MMRIAGRDNEGKAKAIKTDNEGAVNVGLGKRAVKLHDGRMETAFGETVDVSGMNTVMLYVEGEFDAQIKVQGRLNGGDFFDTISIDTITKYEIGKISESGVYIVDCVGFDEIRAYVYPYKSGIITVTAKAVTSDYWVRSTGIRKTLYNERVRLVPGTPHSTPILNIKDYEYVHVIIIRLNGVFNVKKLPYFHDKPISVNLNETLISERSSTVVLSNISSLSDQIRFELSTSEENSEVSIIVMGGPYYDN